MLIGRSEVDKEKEIGVSELELKVVFAYGNCVELLEAPRGRNNRLAWADIND